MNSEEAWKAGGGDAWGGGLVSGVCTLKAPTGRKSGSWEGHGVYPQLTSVQLLIAQGRPTPGDPGSTQWPSRDDFKASD